MKWDYRFLKMAELIAAWSKDPSTKVGAVIVDDNRRIIATGYNGFAKGVRDHPYRMEDRETKYMFTVHAETNALLFAASKVTGCTLYSTFPPCAACAALLIQAGIRRVVHYQGSDGYNERWKEDLESSSNMYSETGVTVEMLERQ